MDCSSPPQTMLQVHATFCWILFFLFSSRLPFMDVRTDGATSVASSASAASASYSCSPTPFFFRCSRSSDIDVLPPRVECYQLLPPSTLPPPVLPPLLGEARKKLNCAEAAQAVVMPLYSVFLVCFAKSCRCCRGPFRFSARSNSLICSWGKL